MEDPKNAGMEMDDPKNLARFALKYPCATSIRVRHFLKQHYVIVGREGGGVTRNLSVSQGGRGLAETK